MAGRALGQCVKRASNRASATDAATRKVERQVRPHAGSSTEAQKHSTTRTAIRRKLKLNGASSWAPQNRRESCSSASSLTR